MEYKKTLNKLFELQKFGMKFGLDSMLNILGKLDNPHKNLSFIHLAGTNGKGSTAAMLTEILNQAGYNTGLYTSPHLITFRERIQVKGNLIAEDEVLSLTEEVWPATDPDNPPTFFEFVTAMAFLYFKRKKTDLAVVETGLGGRLDSTNVIEPILTAITNVSLEHTEHLGHTVTAIAGEKAGIIKKECPFVGGTLCPQTLKVVEEALLENKVRGKLLGRDYKASVVEMDNFYRPTINYEGPDWNYKNLKIALTGPYQADNGGLAVAMAENLEVLGWKISEEALRKGLLSVCWPGRAEMFGPGKWPPDSSGRAVLMIDGAHNPDGALALSKLLGAFKYKNLHLILGVMADKDVSGVLGPMVALADRLYLTQPLYWRAATPEVLLERLTLAFGEPKVKTTLHPKILEAMTVAAQEAEPDDLVVISGSLFTVGEARAILTGAPAMESN
jgi:dihydrofolate synthase/folylpolyglutamate synthase